MAKEINAINLDEGYPVIEVVSTNPYSRHILLPDADLTGLDADIVAVATSVFTDEVKATYASVS